MSYFGFQSPTQGLCLSTLIDRNEEKRVIFDMLGSDSVWGIYTDPSTGQMGESMGEGRKKKKAYSIE